MFCYVLCIFQIVQQAVTVLVRLVCLRLQSVTNHLPSCKVSNPFLSMPLMLLIGGLQIEKQKEISQIDLFLLPARVKQRSEMVNQVLQIGAHLQIMPCEVQLSA